MTRLCALILAFSASSLGQTTWHVSAGAASPGTGTQNAPFPSIQAGIDAAQNSDTVVVGPGTYVELIDFHGKAITVLGAQGSSATILDAHQTTPGVSFGTGEGPNSVLQGLTIRNAYGHN